MFFTPTFLGENKSCRAMIKADYDSPPKNLLDQYQEKMSKKEKIGK